MVEKGCYLYLYPHTTPVKSHQLYEVGGIILIFTFEETEAKGDSGSPEGRWYLSPHWVGLARTGPRTCVSNILT